MGKSTFYSGQPIFSQLFKLLKPEIIKRAIDRHTSDRYYKKFDTRHHLITMLYASYQNCTSLREVVAGFRAYEGHLQHLGITNFPSRSALSEANKKRTYEVFEDIFYALIAKYRKSLQDSRQRDTYFSKLVIIDSTTISLFKEILKNAGRKSMNGKRKGGIKVHTAMYSHEDVPYLIKFSAGAGSDIPFMKYVNPPAGSVIVMDKGYNNYHYYNKWKANEVDWVTRTRNNTHWVLRERLLVKKADKNAGVISDELVRLGTGQNKKTEHVDCRMVCYRDKKLNKTFEFLTSDIESEALKIAAIYKQRWQIELLFKRLKQNRQLNYFLGDNENAIKIQIYCALISDLLLKISLQEVQRKWFYSTMASIVRLHLMSYTRLKDFLEDPEGCKISHKRPPPQAIQLELPLST